MHETFSASTVPDNLVDRVSFVTVCLYLFEDTDRTERTRAACRATQKRLAEKIAENREDLATMEGDLNAEVKEYLPEEGSNVEAFILQAMEAQIRETRLKAENEHLKNIIDQECGVTENQRK